MDKPGPAPPAAQVTTDLPCISCGYNLRTLLFLGSCPECGQPVAKTARHALVYADVEWLRTLRRGAAILAWTPIVTFGCVILCLALVVLSNTLGSQLMESLGVILAFFALFGVFGAWTAGILELTPTPPDSEGARLRYVPVGARACLVVLFLLGFALLGKSLVIAALMLSTLLVQITLLAAHAKRLAQRAGAAGVAKLATATALAGGASLGVVSACVALGGILMLLLPSYGGAGWALIQVGFALFVPVGLLLGVLGTVLMLRVCGVLDRVIEAAEAAPRSADSDVPTTDSESDKAAAE